MKKWLMAGTALLLIQITTGVVLNLTDRDFGAFTPQLELLNFSPSDIDGITIIGAGKEITIKRKNSRWFLADYFNAPADNDGIKALLKKLATVKQGLVVATSKGAAKRFKVSEDNFERHVILRGGDKVLGDFFLGTSPGFKKVHARVNDRQEVVSVQLNNYELEADFEKWLDQKLLRLDESEITGLTMGDIKLTQEGENWVLSGINDNEEIDVEKIKSLIGKIANLRIKAILDQTGSALVGSEPTLSFTIITKDSLERGYTFSKSEEKDYSMLKSSDHDYTFKIDKWRVDEISKFQKNTLLKAKAEEKP